MTRKPKQAVRPLLQGGLRQGRVSKNSYHTEFIAGGSLLVKAVAEQEPARFRAYERLNNHAEQVRGTLLDTESLRRAIDDIYRYPLRQTAVDTLNRQLRSGVTDDTLAQLVIALRDEDRLCLVHEEDERQEPQIICSLGLIGGCCTPPCLAPIPYFDKIFVRKNAMIIKITSKRQVTFPARVLEALGVGPGDQLELAEGPDGYVLRPRRIDLSLLGGLRDKIPSGHPPFDISKFREEGYDPALRD